MKRFISAFALFIGILASGQNPYLPLWEHLPDGEPRVFEDPDNAGHYRVYIIGSHDVRFGSYCGPDIRAWSAPVEDPTNWRDEGPIFTYKIDGQWDVMYAPDLVEIPQKDGSKVYYLYPHSRGYGREAMVCKGTRPDGPFTPINLTEDGRGTLPGSTFGFDPSVFVEPVTDPADPDYQIGYRAYGYWGFQRSSAAQIDQNTMWSVRPGTEVVPYFIPASFSYGNLRPVGDAKYAVYEGEDLGDFNFFEASSIRQVGNKYVWVFSGHSGPDYGLPSSNSTLRYAYSDSPMGPWKSGGVLVDSRAIVLGEDGNSLYEGYSGHNTHGSLQKVGNQWYVFYHRAPRGFGFARQPMVAPVTIQWDKKPVAEGGAVRIYGYDPYTRDHILTVKDNSGHEYKGAEVTSEGFSIRGLDPYKYYSAGYACFLTNKESQQDSWDVWDNAMDITGVRSGDIIGYKYFNFDKLSKAQFKLFLTPKSDRDVKIQVLMDSPYADGVSLGEIIVPAGTDKTVFCLELGKDIDRLKRKHAIYLKAEGEGRGDLFDLHGLGFCKKGEKLDRPVPPTVDIKVNGVSLDIPAIPTRSTEKNGYVSQDIYDIETVQRGTPELYVTASDPDVKISAERVSKDYIVVKCEYKGKTKTYNVRFIDPDQLLADVRTRNYFAEMGYPQEEIDARLQAAFDDVFRGPDKVYFEVGDSLGYISDIKNHDVRTEGMSYGLMIAVQFGEKDIFDRLWRWSKKYMQHQDGPLKGYFAWSLNTDGTHRAEGPASDGELYYVTSLIFASNRWGNDGDINYLAEAQNILNCSWEKDGKNGAWPFINKQNHLITFTPEGFGVNYTDPSYHLPAFYEVWAKWAEDGRADFYLQCAKASREYMHKSINPRTGLNPDTNSYDGSAMTGFARPGRRAPKPSFRYDSWRVPMNMALDYTWSGADKEWKTWYANTIQRFFYSKGIDTFVDQYSVDGTDVDFVMPAGNAEMQVQSLRHSLGLVSTLAAVSLAADNEHSKEFVQRLWDSKNEPYEDGFFDAYYDALLRLFAFMHLSGNYTVIGK